MSALLDHDGLPRLALTVSVVAALSLLAWKLFGGSHKQGPYPPGPKPLPLIGNTFDFPIEYAWLTFAKWSKQYNSDIIHLSGTGEHVIVLNSMKSAVDLLEKRSNIYSDRPRAIMLNEVMGFSFSITNAHYGDEWRKRRRAFHSEFHQGVVGNHQLMQLRKTRAFVAELLQRPTEAVVLSRLLLGATIMKAVYGLESAGKDDKYIGIADDAIRVQSAANVPGAFMVDNIPALKLIPEWVPGAEFQRLGTYARGLIKQMLEAPFQVVKDTVARGSAEPSLASHLIEKGYDDLTVREVAGTAYGAGADTTHGVLAFFLLKMLASPDIQARAHAELDTVVGHDRLPDFGDRPHLPYINAIILETLRWQPVTPLAVPHATSADDVYEGYVIPKGSQVVGNVWAILHDEEAYPDPEAYKPERFLRATEDGGVELDPTVRDPSRFFFGFGRRVCPGNHLAEQSIFAAVATLLATCTIEPARDTQGNPVYPDGKMTTSFLATPEPFECLVKPRSAQAEELITRNVADDI